MKARLNLIKRLFKIIGYHFLYRSTHYRRSGVYLWNEYRNRSLYFPSMQVSAKALSQKDKQELIDKAGKSVQGLPTYNKEQVAEHKDKQSCIWVTYKQGVYDITDLVKHHPGAIDITVS